MTRKSKRELQRAVDDLGDEDRSPKSFGLVYEDPRTGEWYESRSQEGEPVDPDADVLMVIVNSVVMERETAEQEGREILGPTESETNPDADLVRVPWNDSSEGDEER